MATYSHSRISTFENCKLKYKYAYIDKLETDISGSIEAFMGSRVHETLEKLYKDLKFEKKNELKDLLDFYEKQWKEEWDDSIVIVKKDYNQENYKDMGKRMITDYFNRYKPFNQGKIIGLETEDYYDLDDNYKIHVRIDRLSSPEEGVYEIHDYKTNSNMKTQKEADEDRQLAVYSMGVQQMYPDAKKVKLIWHMLAFDKEVVSERTNEQLEILKKEILEEIKGIESENNFEPSRSGLCPYCEYQPICPLWKHKFELEKKPPKEFADDDGLKLVNKYAELKEKEKELSEKIEAVATQIKEFGAYMDVKAVYGKEHAITIWSKDVIKFPRKNDLERTKLIKALKGLNLYEKFLELDNWELEKAFDSFNEIEKQVLLKIGSKQKIMRLYLRERNN